jgi:hypothetical protein
MGAPADYRKWSWWPVQQANLRNAYLVHTAHQRAGARLVAALEGTGGLMVIDLEIGA